MNTTVSEFVCSEIAKESVNAAFLVPGGFVDNLCNAIAESSEIQAYVAASEGGAAMMADGYSRVSRRFGVCIAIAGPGASNMITGLSLSNSDEIPILAITGESPSSWRNRDSIQDCGIHGLNTTNLLALVAKKQYQILDPSLTKDYLTRCLKNLSDLSPGVVHLSLPMEQQAKKLNAESSVPLIDSIKERSFVDVAALQSAKEMLNSHKRSAVLIGSGLRKSDAFAELVEFAEKYSLPVTTTMDAKGDFPENHPLSLGVFGWAGSPVANELLTSNEIDCLFVIGCKLGQVDTMGWTDKLSKGRKIIQLSNNAADLGVTYTPDCSIFADARTALKSLNNEIDTSEIKVNQLYQQRKSWIASYLLNKSSTYEPEFTGNTSNPIHPARVICEAQKALPIDSRVFVDNGAHTFFASHYWVTTQANNFFTSIKYSGAMGWAVPASIGAHIANPASKTVVFVGDGCMLMHGIEIQTAVRYQLKNILFVVLNNSAHGNPKLRTSNLSKKAQEITDISDHDWAKFADSFGLKGMTVRQDKDLASAFSKAADTEEPVLIDVKCGLYPTPTKVFDELFMTDFNKNIDRSVL